jgi:FkbH-like protein
MHINNYTSADLQSYLDTADVSNNPVLNIAILRNITVEGLTPYLRYLAIQMGFRASISYGGFDNVLQDAIGNDDLLNHNTDCIMIFTKLETLSPKLANGFAQLDSSDVEEEKNLVKNYIVSTLQGIRSKTNAVINWQGFELPVYPAFGVIDHTNSDMQVGAINELNDFLKAKLRDVKNGFFIDINVCRSIIGYNRFYDNRYWHIGKAPYTLDALREIANDNFKVFRALKGKNKKCLILDCDNTLWGGILGEDGINGIRIGPNYPGSAYLEFQQEILSLYHRGIIIALCSKNNEPDVWDVIDNHPHMLIKRNHISIAMINWEDKASNIKQIASTLNIGLDSIVFVDDNEFEINLVKEFLPNVETIHLPKGASTDYRQMLASSGLFDSLAFTNEDKIRSQLYKAEITRKEDQGKFTGDIESYYKTLNMVACLSSANAAVTPRVAQLTQKTNQFNLTTKRYSESDIEAFINSGNADVIFVELEDRFGNMGIVGCSIISYREDFAEIDTFLLSCRVIGRGLEKVLLSRCIELAKNRNLAKVIGSYIKTSKNGQVADFYVNNGFIIESGDNDQETRFFYETKNGVPPMPSYYKEINFECFKK